MRTSRTFTACAAALAALGPATVPAGADGQSEYAVKAAFLVNFARYVEWPRGSQSGDIVIGVVGRSPFGPDLETYVKRSQPIGGRSVRARVVEWGQADEVSILFVPASEADSYGRLSRFGKKPVVVVGETSGFAARHGMIGFRIERDRVVFDINPTRAKSAGIGFSSRLLQLARIVGSE